MRGIAIDDFVMTFVIHNLPNKNCASSLKSEIECEDDACAQGIQTYKTEFIDKITEKIADKMYKATSVVVIIEPYSLTNLAINLDHQKCHQSRTAYKTGIEYALQEFNKLENVTTYLDAGHGGLLGLDQNLKLFTPILGEVIGNAGGSQLLRGFATNVGAYQPLGNLSSTADPCNLTSQYNFAIDEAHYVEMLKEGLRVHGIDGMHYIIDTSRNGVTNQRTDCSNWCNVKGSGLGKRYTWNVT